MTNQRTFTTTALIALAVSAVVVIAAWTAVTLNASGGGDQPSRDADALELGTVKGTLSFPRPKPGQQATHMAGGILPCLRGGDAEVATVTGIEVPTEPASARGRVFLRRIPALKDRTGDNPLQWAPLVSWDGTVERAVSRGEILGDVKPLEIGDEFALTCPAVGEVDVAAPLDELLIEGTATDEGALVDGVVIRYRTATGAHGKARAQTSVLMCGSEITSEHCHDS